MIDGISPEEKLLNLIKGSRESEEKKGVPRQVEETSQVKKESKSKEQIPASVKKRGKELGNPFPLLNRFLVLGMLGVLIYMGLGYIFPYKSKTEIPEHVEVSKAPELAEKGIGVLPPLSNYTGVVGGRQIFKVYEPPRPKPVGPSKPKVTLQQLLSGYTFTDY